MSPPQYLLAVQSPRTDSLVAWVAVTGAPAVDLRLTVDGRVHPLGDAWETFTAPGAELRVQRVMLNGLAAGQDHLLSLLSGGGVVANATGETLPATLPSPPDRPFTILLGSCFSVLQDAAGLVGAAIARLPSTSRPHVSILCGDQVYLDSPSTHFLVHTHSKEELASEHLARYLLTWSQSSAQGGFQRLIAGVSGAFESDDHEYWNNSPYPAAYARDTWTADGRAAWGEIATALYRLFEAPRAGEVITVGAVSCFVADTRIARTFDGSSFMTGDQMTALVAWIRGLTGPGLLVTGQPVFVDQTGWKGYLFDRGLADYAQYGELVRSFAAARHDIVVLTGDFHFGRVATCELPSGQRLHEIISSPLALVDRLATGKWAKAPEMFPAAAVPGVAQAPVSTGPYRRIDDHFATVAFTGVGGSVHMDVVSWPIRTGAGPWGDPVMSTVLH